MFLYFYNSLILMIKNISMLLEVGQYPLMKDFIKRENGLY